MKKIPNERKMPVSVAMIIIKKTVKYSYLMKQMIDHLSILLNK